MKETILGELGETHLLLPALLERALAANDRVKYLIALAQTARQHAGAPDEEIATLRAERLAAGVRDDTLDEVVGISALESESIYRIPGAARIVQLALDQTREMLAPLADDHECAPMAHRLAGLATRLDAVHGDRITVEQVAVLSSADPAAGDSLHLLVMDVHKALNQLHRRLATDVVDGARVFGTEPADRDLVAAFMQGIKQTSALRLEHPGLDTTATRSAGRLVIQNDIGLTDAHVVVIHVAGLIATTTYTDIHPARMRFFQEIVGSGWSVHWEGARSHAARSVEGGQYLMTVGTFEAADEKQLARYLRHLGSRLVFLIDWNRARKRLGRLVRDRAAVELLRWAAEHEIGHRAFLVLGGEHLIYDALDTVARDSVRAGATLEDTVGREAAAAFLQEVLRRCSEDAAAGRPSSLTRDEVTTELLATLRGARRDNLEPLAEHAELIIEMSCTLQDALLRGHSTSATAARAEAAARAKQWESTADAILNRVRAAERATSEQRPCRELLEVADDVADELEEAAFQLRQMPPGPLAIEVETALGDLARDVLLSAREYLKAIEIARALTAASPRIDVDDFLAAIHRILSLEHQTDDAERRVTEALHTGDGDVRLVLAVTEVAKGFEQAADALMRVGLKLRAHVLGSVLAVGTATPAARAEPVRVSEPARPGSAAVYEIAEGTGEGRNPESMGSKAYNLARMAAIGLPVPEAVVLGTSLSREYMMRGALPDGFRSRLAAWLKPVEHASGLIFGSERRPLLLAVRSGAPVSMPGMLDTILDVGLNDATARGLLRLTGNPRLVWDSYWRLVRSFGETVFGCAHEPFDDLAARHLSAAGREDLRELDAPALAALAHEGIALVARETGRPFPQDPLEQLEAAVEAVLRSLGSERATAYGRLHELPNDLGTGVLLQRMVFGNAGGVSGAGVGFTRDPSTGANRLYFDFLFDAQGEDVVAGRHRVPDQDEMARIAPAVLTEVGEVRRTLEAEFRDAQEFEFTVEDSRLFVLQTRTAKRTSLAALQIAVDQVREGLIDPETALQRISDLDLDGIRVARLEGARDDALLCHATSAGIGVARGEIALDAARAQQVAASGRPVVLVREDVSTADVAGVAVSEGLLAAAGGRTSHAAVVARELGKVCLVGCSELDVDLEHRSCTIAGRELLEGDPISLDGNSGSVYAGAIDVLEDVPTAQLAEVAAWRARIRTDAPDKRSAH
jgi:pyruvate,orthophosphate dikinase